MNNEIQTNRNRPVRTARLAGLLWLLTIVGGMFSFLVGGKFVVAHDAAATTANILAREWALQEAGAANVIATVCYLGVTVLMYELLVPRNRSVALFGLVVSLVGCTLGGLNSLLFLTLISLSRTGQSISTVLSMNVQASNMGFVFFGCHVISIGYIILCSSFFPRVLGGLLAFTGLCYLVSSFSSFFSLPFAGHLAPIVAASALLGEGTMTFWLLVKGINWHRWHQEIEPSSIPA